jgi:hypothetical protein
VAKHRVSLRRCDARHESSSSARSCEEVTEERGYPRSTTKIDSLSKTEKIEKAREKQFVCQKFPSSSHRRALLVAMSAEDAIPDFAALIAQARRIAEQSQAGTCAPFPGPEVAAQRAKLLEADKNWGAAVAPDGTRYFFDKHTGVAQWHEPTALQGAGLQIVPGEVLPNGPTLPAPWRELTDAQSKKKYYWDASTGATRWRRPVPGGLPTATIVSPKAAQTENEEE